MSQVFQCIGRTTGTLVTTGANKGEVTAGQVFNQSGNPRIDCRGTRVKVTHSGSTWSTIPFKLNAQAPGVNGACMTGGASFGDVKADERWGSIYPSANRWAVMLWHNNQNFTGPMLVEGFCLHGGWDGVGIYRVGNAANPVGVVTIRGCWFSLMRDDVIEADDMEPIVLTDNLLEGGWVWCSQNNTAVGNRNTKLSIHDGNLIYMQRMNSDGSGLSNSSWHGILKVSGNAPKQRFINNTLRADHPRPFGGVGADPLYEWRPVNSTFRLNEQVANNVFVWGGKAQYGSYAAKFGAPPPGWTVTEDVNVWVNKANSWKASHDAVQRLPGVVGG
jgi:hypothetical protein